MKIAERIMFVFGIEVTIGLSYNTGHGKEFGYLQK